MWDDYRINGAQFTAGDDVESPEVRQQQLRKEAETFGLWNPETTARKLGFGDKNGPADIEEDEEDDFLANIMENIEIPEDGVIRKIWHAAKWHKTMDLDILSPMYDAGFVIPIWWVKFWGRIYADAFSITFDDQDLATINDTKTMFICAEDLTENYYDLEQAAKIPKWRASTIDAGVGSRAETRSDW
ncbi:hypothetical protein MVEN_00307100 [Mycena venus]|uniref:Uncharacterized protein n=1 Tax=Mycena venus TaxID=2733690 RepID=A0A8H6YZ72_9AGAR|nr:hypothetical protein MVEN_00307100 [Mycena venus]